MDCAIYKSSRKTDYYLYVERKHGQEDDFSSLPETLTKLLGELEFVMQLELSERRKLALADINEVIESLQQHGFYLQTPPRYEKINFIENSKMRL